MFGGADLFSFFQQRIDSLALLLQLQFLDCLREPRLFFQS